MENPDPPEMPFGGFPFFGDLSKILGGTTKGGADAARQLAVNIANEGKPEPNVEPEIRIEIEQLARVAELQVLEATGLSAPNGSITVTSATKTQWAEAALGSYRPLIERLTTALSDQSGFTEPTDEEEVAEDPMAAMFSQIMSMLGPMMLSITAGSMIGHLAQKSLGTYDIPVPRNSTDILVIPANLDSFSNEWSLPAQDLRLWVCLHEITHHLVLGVPHVGRTINQMLLDYAAGFQTDPNALEQRLGQLDLTDPSAMQDLQTAFGDPETVLGMIQSPEQRAMMPRLKALTAVIVGFVDYTMDAIGGQLIESYDQLTEALRRRRVEADPSNRLIEHMLGLELTQEQYDRGSAFVAGVVERGGPDALSRLWKTEKNLPTPNEVDAAGLWLARIDLPEDLLGD